jgi:hypothetical protein
MIGLGTVFWEINLDTQIESAASLSLVPAVIQPSQHSQYRVPVSTGCPQTIPLLETDLQIVGHVPRRTMDKEDRWQYQSVLRSIKPARRVRLMKDKTI